MMFVPAIMTKGFKGNIHVYFRRVLKQLTHHRKVFAQYKKYGNSVSYFQSVFEFHGPLLFLVAVFKHHTQILTNNVFWVCFNLNSFFAWSTLSGLFLVFLLPKQKGCKSPSVVFCFLFCYRLPSADFLNIQTLLLQLH